MKFQFFRLVIAILFVSVLISSCKKEEDLNDPTVYSWKRELFMRDFTKDNLFNNPPSFNRNKDFNPENSFSLSSRTSFSGNYTRGHDLLIRTEFVQLTNAQVKEEKQKKENEGPGIYFYTYTKVNR